MAMGPEDYPGRTPRRYVLTHNVHDLDRKIMYDPAAFYFGHFRRLTRAEKRAALRTWQTYWSNGNDFLRLFEIPFVQRTCTRERNGNGCYVREEMDLRSLPIPDLEHAIKCEIRARQSLPFKAAHLWNLNGDKELFDLDKLRVSQTPHTGTIVTTAMVHADSNARNSNVAKYRMVSIDDLFGPEGHFIPNAASPSEDFAWAHTKEGRTDVIVIDKHLAAVMDLAKHHPEAFRGYTAKNGTVCLPFDFSAAFHHKGVRYRHPEYFPGRQPPRDVLLTDILMYWLFKDKNGATQFDISKKLMQMHFLMDPSVIDGIRTGTLKPEVLTQGWATPKIPLQKVRILRALFSEINTYLVDSGFALDGHTLEFGNFSSKGELPNFETVAWNYVSHDASARVLFHPEYTFPPLVMYKTRVENSGKKEVKHDAISPIALLAKPHISADDWTRRQTQTLVEVPNVFIPYSLMHDYREAIAAQYPGGIPAFRRYVTKEYMYGNAEQRAMGRKMLALVKE